HDRDHQDHWRSDREEDGPQDAIERRLHPVEVRPSGLTPGESRSVRVGVYRRLATASVHSPQLPFDCPMRPWPPANTNTTDSGQATGGLRGNIAFLATPRSQGHHPDLHCVPSPLTLGGESGTGTGHRCRWFYWASPCHVPQGTRPLGPRRRSEE